MQIPTHLTEFPVALDGAAWRERALFLPELMCVVFSPCRCGGLAGGRPLASVSEPLLRFKPPLDAAAGTWVTLQARFSPFAPPKTFVACRSSACLRQTAEYTSDLSDFPGPPHLPMTAFFPARAFSGQRFCHPPYRGDCLRYRSRLPHCVFRATVGSST